MLRCLRPLSFRVLALAGVVLWGASLSAQTTLTLPSYTGTSFGDIILPNSFSTTFLGGTTFGPNATLGSSSSLTFNQDDTLIGKTILIGSGSSYGYIVTATGRTLNFGTGTTVTGVFDIYGNSGAVVGNQGTITANAGTSYLYGPTVTNSGTLNAQNATLYFGYYNGEAITNAAGGNIVSDGASANIFLHSIVNQGTVTVQNSGTVTFTGSNNSSDLGSVSLASGGHAYLNNTINNASATLAAPTGGQFELHGGTITGGTIGAGALGFTSTGGTLNGVTYTGDLTLGSSTSVTFQGGTGITGTTLTINPSATLTWDQDGALAGTAIAMGSGSSYGYLNVGANRTLTLGAGTTVNGVFDIYGNSGATIVNQGGITATGGTSYLYAPVLTNQGTILAANASLYFGYYSGENVTNAAGATITADGASAIVYLNGAHNNGTLLAQNSGRLYFSGNYTTADIGAVTLATSGRALLAGNLDNPAATLTAPTGGVFELYGGTIEGGTVNSNALGFTSSGCTLNGVAYAGDLALGTSQWVTLAGGTTVSGANLSIASNATLTWDQDGTLAGKTLTLGTGSSYGYLNVSANRTLTLGAGTTLVGAFDVYGSTGAAVINQGAVTATSGTAYLYAPVLANQGTITALNASLYYGYYSGETTTNDPSGTITADGASGIAYLHGLSNSGSLVAQNGGRLVFNGNFNTAGLGNVTLSGGGRALVAGALDNTAATLTAPTGGQYELYGGTITGGTIASGALGFTTSGGTLSGTQYQGNLTLGNSASVTFTGGASYSGSSLTIAPSANFTWNQTGTLSATTIAIGSAGSLGYLNVGSGQALTFDNATTISGTFDVYGNTGATIVNQGTATATSGTSYLYAPTLVNQGAVTASNASLYFGYNSGESITNAAGGSLVSTGANGIIYAHSLVNQGSVAAQSSGKIYFTGTNATADLGNVAVSGGGRVFLQNALDNTAATLTAPTGGPYELYSGTITGGTVGAGALKFTSSGGTLSGVTIADDLNVGTSAWVTLTNGSTFTGANAAILNSAGVYWSQDGTLTGKTITLGSAGSYGSLQVNTANTLTFDPTTTVTGTFDLYAGNTGTIVNQGTIASTAGTSYLYGQNVVNQGTVNAQAGTLYLGYYSNQAFSNTSTGTINLVGGNAYIASPHANAGLINIQSGTLSTNGYLTNAVTGVVKGSGTLTGGIAFTGGTLAPGNSIGTLTLNGGNFLVTGSTVFDIELGGVSADKVNFVNPGTIDIGAGLLQLSLTLLSAPTYGSTYTLMNISSGGTGISGYFAGLPNSGDSISAMFGATQYTFQVQYLGNSIVLAIPEPSTYALLGAGLLLAALRGRRRA